MKISLSFILVFITVNLFAQNLKKANYKWQKPLKSNEIPEKFKNEDAVIIKKTNYVQTVYQPDVKTTGSVYKKIKILTQKGLEEHSKIYFKYNPDHIILILDARTIKANGKIVDLDSKEINKSEFKNKNYGDTYLIYTIPGVEVGDEIEMVYTYEYDYLLNSGHYFFHEKLPIMASKMQFAMQKGVVLEVKMYNDLPQPKITEGTTLNNFKWKLNGLEGYKSAKSSILENDLPHIAYVIRKVFTPQARLPYIIVPDNWADVLKTYGKYIVKQEGSIASGNKFELEYIEKESKKDSSILNNIKQFHQTICSNFEVFYSENSVGTIGKQLSEGKINRLSLFRLYADFCEFNNISYKLCVGRTKYNGILDGGFPTLYGVNYVFMSFEDEKGNNHYLFPSTSNKEYYINQIPYQLEGTMFIQFDPFNTADNKFLAFPISNPTNNKEIIRDSVLIKFDDFSNPSFYSEVNCKGNFFTKYSNTEVGISKSEINSTLIKKLERYNDLQTIDTAIVLKDNSNIYKYSYQYSTKDFITKLDQNLFYIGLDKIQFFDIYLKSILTDERKLDFYNAYSSVQSYEMDLIFDKEVKLENPEDFQRKFSNDFGMLNISIKQKDDKTIRVKAYYSEIISHVLLENINIIQDMKNEIKELRKLKITFSN